MILFNDPFSILVSLLNLEGMVYHILQSLQESTFIGLLFFFWLLLMHTIASQDMVITIDDGMFFMPKVILCFIFTVYLIMMRMYIYVQFEQDPFFDVIQERHVMTFYNIVFAIGVIISTCYMIYFCLIMFRALKTIKNLKSQYRFAFGATIFVSTISSMIMINNG